MWKNIEGYFWPYRINEKAEVQRQIGPDEWKTLTNFVTRDGGRYRRLRVRMRLPDGRYTNVLVKNLMIDAFMGGRKPGMFVTFRNGMVSDCALENLVYTTPTEVGKRYGGCCRRPVVKIDKRGRVVEAYGSVSEAARKNYMSTKAVQWRCDKKVRDPYKLNGFTFRYER